MRLPHQPPLPSTEDIVGYLERTLAIIGDTRLDKPPYPAIAARYSADIEAIGKTILIALLDEGAPEIVASGFGTLFLYGYTRGQAEAKEGQS